MTGFFVLKLMASRLFEAQFSQPLCLTQEHALAMKFGLYCMNIDIPDACIRLCGNRGGDTRSLRGLHAVGPAAHGGLRKTTIATAHSCLISSDMPLTTSH